MVEEEILMLKASIASLNLDLKQKRLTIDELNNEIDLLKVESADKSEKLLESETKNKELKDTVDTLLVEKNKLEDESVNLKQDVRLYSNAFKRLKASNHEKLPDNNAKGSKNSDVEARCRKLGQRVSEL